MKNNDLQHRLFEFSISVINEVRKFPKEKEYQVISCQLLKSATSVGANYEEAQAAVSIADFINKIGISLKEMRETNYWIRIVVRIFDDNIGWENIEKESEELKNILGNIYVKTRIK